MNWFSKKPKRELVAIFDIGSSSVGGSLLFTDKNSSPEIVFSTRIPIPIQEKLDFDRFLESTLKITEEIGQKLSSAGFGAPTKIHCVLSSLWYVSQTRVIHIEKNNPFMFTEKLADDLIKKEIDLFKEEHLAHYAKEDKKLRLLEYKNLKTSLNGYVTSEPIGKKAQKAEIVMFMSMSSEYILEKIEITVGKYFHTSKIKFSSFIMASFTVARDMFIHKENFLLIDIGGEVSDISMTKKEVLLESITFPMGRNFLFRNLALALGDTIDHTKSAFIMHKEGHLEKTAKEKFDKALTDVSALWLKNFQESLVNLSNDISIPSTIFVTADEDVAPWFVDTIKNEQFNQYTLTESKFKVIIISTAMLHGIATFRDNAARDMFIIIESIYINRFLN